MEKSQRSATTVVTGILNDEQVRPTGFHVSDQEWPCRILEEIVRPGWLQELFRKTEFDVGLVGRSEVNVNLKAQGYSETVRGVDKVQVMLALTFRSRDDYQSAEVFLDPLCHRQTRNPSKFALDLTKIQPCDLAGCQFTTVPIEFNASRNLIMLRLYFNPTVAVLGPLSSECLAEDFKFPKLTGQGRDKRNHFLPHYLLLPSQGFDFQSALFDFAIKLENFVESCVRSISKHGSVDSARTSVEHAEFYVDVLTTRPIETYRSMSRQCDEISILLKPRTKGYSSDSSFLSVYAWDGPESRTASFAYTALTGFSFVKSSSRVSELFGCSRLAILRTELRIKPNRKAYQRVQPKVVIPKVKGPLDVSQGQCIADSLLDALARACDLDSAQSLRLVQTGSVNIRRKQLVSCVKALETEPFAMIASLETKKRKTRKEGRFSSITTLSLATSFRRDYVVERELEDLDLSLAYRKASDVEGGT